MAIAAKTFTLPSSLFSNGWSHLLGDAELAFLMMLTAVTQPDRKGEWVKISSKERLLQYGIGRDAYAAYKTLSAVGLLNVHHDEGRRSDAKVMDYKLGVRPRLDAFKLEPDAFEESALDVMKEYLELTGTALQVERGLPHREQFANLRQPQTQPLRTPDE